MLCEKCKKEHLGNFGSGRFCSIQCSNSKSFNSDSIEKLRIAGRRKKTEEHKRNISSSLKNKPFSGTPYRGSIFSQERNNKISGSLKDRIFSKEHKNNLRLAQKRWMDKYGIFPRFNPKACEPIDKYGKENGYNFQHALNNGEFHIKELGYWVGWI